jgi:hypothetical protein
VNDKRKYSKVYESNTSHDLPSETTTKLILLTGTSTDQPKDKSSPNNQIKSSNQSISFRNETYKDILLILVLCFIALLVITALILPSVLLYLMVPVLCKNFHL